ncbi:hypothetical protein NP590_00155 [Methylomonas sp. SURF-2]|uniref:Uncharacterized protein n=1 Tax=Methylomonas subterranea TaxID=2952225 RepID=A0ABT1TB52_9GAMM|nr:hypothetical protein [Methylomonas sp. SURF-2]MCQ8102498.1 hypothetical protein [Methylomonas sp. SURF-2]
MFEIIVLSMLLVLFASCLYTPFSNCLAYFIRSGSRQSGSSVEPDMQAGKSAESHTFLTYLKSEVEAELFPRPTDSVLRRHYDALVAAELQNRLALMAE